MEIEILKSYYTFIISDSINSMSIIIEIRNITLAILEFVPKTMGIGPRNIIPPPLTLLSSLEPNLLARNRNDMNSIAMPKKMRINPIVSKMSPLVNISITNYNNIE